MKGQSREGFILPADRIRNDILVPRYYDPRIAEEVEELQPDFEFRSLAELVGDGHVEHDHGDYVPKIHYGTGPYPYIRTSDLANWEINASPKHGVPEAVYNAYSASQNVRPGDILLVHEGTYLIGTVALVTEFDGPLLYQHHLAKLRATEAAPFSSHYLLAALASPIVQRQIRTKQFPADIIDSIVGRLEEVLIPLPRDESRLRRVEAVVRSAITERAALRERIAYAAQRLDTWMQGESRSGLDEILSAARDAGTHRRPTLLGGRRTFSATLLSSDRIRNDVLLPKYYDPWVDSAAAGFRERCELRTVGHLVAAGALTLQTGDEIGRLNYGTGDVPFIRTSDFGSWELKGDPKHGVSRAVLELWSAAQDLKSDDILLVRDGTYLVGTSVLVSEQDLPLLFCGGIYRIRSEDRSCLPPGLLFALLNTPFVRRQMRNIQFTRDVIDTLGQRVLEIVLPIPLHAPDREKIGSYFSTALAERGRLRSKLRGMTQGFFTAGGLDLA